ncbi:TIMELESS-interacting protein isoform X2 [Lepisosteus oculatus]|nr:PREDICTED: TIMELESS-interacting protein isoform X2 [Lepisosteus oculatus]XP_015198551.1 PREDICTED: TIMELESS-interacting protein isoform X2 [Lepisosteus oculatus]XP_015198552.1 PREDICTED: TIMELESS-interacting protein isoform X2 [Lepisosteus oculatus]XP_015198553.1 PREDICTED: TIMELESS-interacting protein isoform X2 [Lepisosteus oculatus]XP_015198554.1 PREDICTED: TIMELESS-interacting protein isoform X2 [Lepisosteus oculatus]
MIDPLENSLFDLPDYENTEDEAFPPLPPPLSPGREGSGGDGDDLPNGEDAGETSRLDEAPIAKRRAVKRPQPKLDSQRLVSERGLPALRTLFDNVRFKGKGHEAEDLKLLIQKMENWAHRLYPKLQFDDFIDKLESLGSKKEVQTCLKRIRLDMPLTHEDFVGKDDEAEEEERAVRESSMLDDPDPFLDSSGGVGPVQSTPAAVALTEEQRRRMELNKQLALERRLARLQESSEDALQSESQSQLAAATEDLSEAPGDLPVLDHEDSDAGSRSLDQALTDHAGQAHHPTVPQERVTGLAAAEASAQRASQRSDSPSPRQAEPEKVDEQEADSD